MVDATIIAGVKRYLEALSEAGISASFAVVFGSYATGTANELSDIDLLVVSSEFDGVISRNTINKLWHVAARTDSRIEPVACGEIQWQEDVSNAIIEVARCEGQRVSAA